MEAIEITPVARPINGRIRPPGSKSITNRALVCAALAEGRSRLTGALKSEDTEVMVTALRELGIAVNVSDVSDDGTTIVVEGCGGKIPSKGAELYVANSGTSVRFLTALVALATGDFRLDGNERMRERPIAELVDALEQLGVSARCEMGTGCPPVAVAASGIEGGQVRLRGDLSSQYLSAILMSVPYAKNETVVEIVGPLVSEPYVAMTLAVMREFGIDVTNGDDATFRLPSQQQYTGREYAIEPDASAASYFWAAAAITGGKVTVEGLSQKSLQGDVAFCDCLAQMGCDVQYESDGITVIGRPLSGITTDMRDVSDTVQTLAAVALFADGPTTITGVGHIRHKETDRIGNLAIELRRLGATVEELSDGLRIVPATQRAARIQTYDDHRMAMSLSLIGLRTPGVVIEEPGCTRKTYPRYFQDLEQLCHSS